MPRFALSKSALQAGAQCPRQLWIRHNYGRPHHVEDEDGDEGMREMQFVIGDKIGDAARWMFFDETCDDPFEGKAYTIDTTAGFGDDSYEGYYEDTRAHMRDAEVSDIAEAAFYDKNRNLIVFVDVLHRQEPGSNIWDIYEVKASGHISPFQQMDAAWQTYIARSLACADRIGEIGDTYMVHPHPQEGWRIIALIMDAVNALQDVVENLRDDLDGIAKRLVQAYSNEYVDVPMGLEQQLHMFILNEDDILGIVADVFEQAKEGTYFVSGIDLMYALARTLLSDLKTRFEIIPIAPSIVQYASDAVRLQSGGMSSVDGLTVGEAVDFMSKMVDQEKPPAPGDFPVVVGGQVELEHHPSFGEDEDFWMPGNSANYRMQKCYSPYPCPYLASGDCRNMWSEERRFA